MVYDTKNDRIVNNESIELAKALNEWANPNASEAYDVYPAGLRAEIDRMIDWIYPINNGVYRCGFANS